MNRLQLVDKLNHILRYARKNYMRLLIEIEPDYKKLWIYTDRGNEEAIASQLMKYGLADKKKSGIITIMWGLTCEKMYYPGNRPKMSFLKMAKGKIKKRFYNPNVNIDKDTNNRYEILFIEIKGEIPEIIKDRFVALTAVMKEEEVDDMHNLLLYYEYPECYKVNRLGEKKLALYKY
jgi:hypothetical protein